MKSILLTITAAAFIITGNAQENQFQKQTSESLDADPVIAIQQNIPSNKALWDIQLEHNITAEITGNNGFAGVAFINNEFWVSKWTNDTITKFSSTGAFISEFVINGLSATRSLTTDGTYLYAGNNTNTIYRIDPASTFLAPPHITSASANTTRLLTFDQTLNGGAGGFWTGNFNTDIDAINMSGAVINTIPVATHGQASMYGGAIDNGTSGGPYLWIYSQIAPNDCQITALQMPAGTPVAGYNYDSYVDFAATYGLTTGLAGGIFLSTTFMPGTTSLIGILQGTPNRILFSYEIQAPLGIESLIETEKELVKITDFMGREVDFKENTPLIYFYSDGSIKRVFEMK